MLFGGFGRGVEVLLAVSMMLIAMPAAAGTKAVPRHSAQITGEAKRAMQEITAEMQRIPPQEATPETVLLRWEPVSGAVRYAVRVLRAEPDGRMSVVETMERVYTTGLHLPLLAYGTADGLYWSVQPLDYDGVPLGRASEPRSVRGETAQSPAPVLTDEYAEMPYAPLYPVYSWIPLAGQRHHEVEVYRRTADADRYLHTLQADEYDVYDEMPFTVPGIYLYRVRGVTQEGEPLSAWSDYGTFTVAEPVPIAALGDSITHGGGAITTPPSYRIYDWETYCSVPVKNLGHSGDTTAAMLARFEHDVLPFAPRVLLIMGGVNDYRVGIDAAKSVDNLIALREKCAAHGITPIFLTPTPIRPALMTARMDITPPPEDWYEHQEYINDWVMQQEFHIEVARTLADAHSELEAEYTTDGLHPDLMGKKYIGERVDAYLREHFAFAAGAAERRVRMLKADGK